MVEDFQSVFYINTLCKKVGDNVKQNIKYDIVIIGAGIAGATIARELSKFNLKVAVIEKEAEVCFGQTKGTHGIVHSGLPYYKIRMPLKDRAELRGNSMMPQLCKDLDVPYEKTGKLLVAFNDQELFFLKEIELLGKRNGAQDIQLFTDKNKLKEMEPNLSDEVIAALYTPSTGVSSPWGLVYGLIENALDNGVELFVDTEVLSINNEKDNEWIINTSKGKFFANYIINSAGIFCEKIANMIGDYSFKINGTRHQRIILDKKTRDMVKHVIRGIKAGGLPGSFVSPTVYGDLMVGEKAEKPLEIGDTKVTREGLENCVIPEYLKIIPNLSPSMSIKPFAGFISSGGPDYIVRPSEINNRLVHVVLGGSGFTASPAVAEYVVQEVLRGIGVSLEEKEDFNPYRKNIPRVRELNENEIADLLAKDLRFGHVVCRCENVTEGEIIEAIKRGATTRDGVKYRTQAGMGRCQSGFCGTRVLKILSRELNIPMEKVTRKGNGSIEALYETKELLNDSKKEDLK